MKNNTKNCFTTRTIDIESIYINLKGCLERRYNLQRKYDALWDEIKRYHCNRSSELKNIADHIGLETHNINRQISNLCKYKRTHKAMNLAYRYINEEISRIENIIRKQESNIRAVAAGRIHWVDSSGYSHTDSSSMINYVNQKKNQLSQLRSWRNYISRYLV